MEKRKKRQRELKEQSALVKWFEYQYPGERLVVSANGGSRHPIEAMNLKRSGVRKGVPDILLPVIKDGEGCLWIEFKPTPIDGEPKPRVTKEQIEMIDYLKSKGHTAMVCYGIDEAMAAINNHLGESNG